LTENISFGFQALAPVIPPLIGCHYWGFSWFSSVPQQRF